MMPEREDCGHQRPHTSFTQLGRGRQTTGGASVEKERVAGSAFGALLRRHRLAAGLSQEVLAERARMSVNGVSALERGDRRYPYRATVTLLTTALGLSPAAAAAFEAAAARPRQPHDRTGAEAAIRQGRGDATNLPLQRTSLIGRETEIADIVGILQERRLVTVTGAGGVGKTRTALAVGDALLETTTAGVWLVELAPVQRSFVESAVAQLLNVRESANRPLLETLLAHLGQKSLLLILDNCEHVIAEAAAVAGALLNGCPHLQILATSREPLRIAGEHLYRLPSLSLPTPLEAARLTASQATDHAAILLFVERARAIDHGFALSDDNAPIVADICRRLDGLPLAIELAAARVKVLSPRQLRERLDRRFRLLAGGGRDALPRQQTIRALIDWSHNLLDARERTLFRRLGIFANGFTLEGAAAVAGGEDPDELDVFDVLSSLADKSLLVAEPHGDTLRYRFLESTRAYAAEKLDAAGERELVASRHLRYFSERFAELYAEFERSRRTAPRRDAFTLDLEDLRVALDGALERSEIAAGAELLAALERIWSAFGLTHEGIARHESLIAVLPETEPRLLARLWATLAMLYRVVSEFRPSREAARKGVAYARSCGEGQVLSQALLFAARLATLDNDHDAAEVAIVEADAIPSVSPRVRFLLREEWATLKGARGDLKGALELVESLRREERALGNNDHVLALQIAELTYESGDPAKAVDVVREVLPALRDRPDTGRLANILANLAGYLAAMGEVAEALQVAHEALLLIAPQRPSDIQVIASIDHIALACALQGDLSCAAILAGYAEAAFAREAIVRQYTERATFDRLTRILRDGVAQDELARLTAEGVALSAETAIALALEASAGPNAA